jgi:hypothetical protein
MAPSPTKTLWILGAGFSRALGGPLIEDLLITRGRDYLKQVGQHFDPLAGENLQLKIYAFGTTPSNSSIVLKLLMGLAR